MPFGWFFRHAAGLQIGRAGTHPRGELTEARYNHAAVCQLPDAHGEIDVLFHQVHISIHQLQLHPDVWKLALEFRDNGLRPRTAGAVMISSP